MSEVFSFSDRLTVLPIVHGSGDMTVAVRQRLLAEPVDCLAVPLPASWEDPVSTAIQSLPEVAVVVQRIPESPRATYVPIDPCQPVIGAIRWALAERVRTAWIDWETPTHECHPAIFPDPYALRRLTLEQYAVSVLPSLTRPPAGSWRDQRCRRLAFELHRLELDHERMVALVNILDWPWIREAYIDRAPYPPDEAYFEPIHTLGVDPSRLAFLLGELPYVTALYERARRSLAEDENLSIDGIKELVLEARDRLDRGPKAKSSWITPALLSSYLQYARNITLMERRLCPDLYTLVVAAKQVGGDRFARSVLETAKDYPIEYPNRWTEQIDLGIDRGVLADGDTVNLESRLPGVPKIWRSCELLPEPPEKQRQQWAIRWDPYQQCSWPPEDNRIECFHTHVRQQAKALLGADLARTEKFTTSIKDGIDIRETLRNWHKGEIHVKDIPPARGGLEIVVFLFDVPADPAEYPWRTTWHAEHADESTIGLFATDFRRDLVGPGIGRARYGGVFFIYPPRFIPDIWQDPRIPSDVSLEEQLLAGAIIHSNAPHIAVVSPVPLKASWKRLAARHRRKLIHLPLSRFSSRTVEQVRTVHVLNGKDIRSYAARFIRDE